MSRCEITKFTYIYSDIIGTVTKLETPKAFQRRCTHNGLRRKVTIKDETRKSIQVVFWGEDAASAKFKLGQEVMLWNVVKQTFHSRALISVDKKSSYDWVCSL